MIGASSGGFAPSLFLILSSGIQLLTPFWLAVSVTFDIFIGFIPFVALCGIWPWHQWSNNHSIRRIWQKPMIVGYIFDSLRMIPFVIASGFVPWLQARADQTEIIPPKVHSDVSMNDIMTGFANRMVKMLDMKPKRNVVRPAHLHSWLALSIIKIILWGVFLIGVMGDLLLSIGWVNPFLPTSPDIYGIGFSMPGWLFDLFFARANGQPNGAHIISYLGVPLFGLVVAYKFRPKGMLGMVGDVFQGLTAAGFLGAVHELIWIAVYYLGYWQYLSWDVLPEFIRDISFVIMMVLLFVTFWKFKGRKLSMKIFLWPTIAFTVLCVAWFFIPHLVNPSYYGWLPITTIDNHQFGNGLYQKTPWFSVPWVNAIEVISWVMLYSSYIFVVVRYKK